MRSGRIGEHNPGAVRLIDELRSSAPLHLEMEGDGAGEGPRRYVVRAAKC